MNKEIIRANGITAVETSDGKKDVCEETNDLMETLSIDNNIEYLKGRIDYSENEIAKLNGNRTRYWAALTLAKWCKWPMAILALISSILLVNAPAVTLEGYIFAVCFPITTVGILEICKLMIKHKDEKAADMIARHEVVIKFIEADLEKEYERKKSEVVYKEEPAFVVEKVDTKELNAYMERYADLYKLYDSIETVEAEEVGKAKTMNRPFYRK